ncbi:hypothetical protein SAMN05421640_3499 [Ekhidna lutea]|uniref:Outer membrane protein beta-barrel domain-containing protein n=1 Tax=Ekhidna lutea TaxID=447679 RepID=A0A239LYL3_EKHLU|nr:hypothetical protein [Ekhidna lutea]SNT35561.1 hypothetical protein SAMN05421640_3499 [Ekhidna lutea]
MIQRNLILSVLFFSSFLSVSQVREVRSRANAFKNSSSSYSSNSNSSDYSYSSDDSEGSLFLIDLFIGMMRPMVQGVSLAQQAQLENIQEERWRAGLDLKLNGGINFKEAEFFDTQMLRANYGLFSTQLRRFNLNDVSGDFTTIDWQILQLNLINTENLRWVVGGGVSNEYQTSQSHFEWTTDLYVMTNRFMPYITYRKSGDGYPREEFSVQMEYRPFKEKNEEFAFGAGYVHQMNYDVRFDFVTVGVSFYLK